MLKKSMLVLAIMALLVGTLLAQPMKVEGNDDLGYGRNGMMNWNHKMMGDNNHHRASRGMGMGMNNHKGNHKMMNMEPGRMILAMSEELELSETQIENIKEIQVNFKKASNTKQAEIENLQIDKREAMQNKDFKTATKVTKNLFKIKEELALSRVSAIENIYSKLTESQKDLLETNCKMK